MSRGPELVEELQEVLMQELDDEHVVMSVIDTLCSYLGGRQVYFPQNYVGITQKRNACMLEDKEDGMTMPELIEKYRMSEASVRRTIRREKERLWHERQQSIFGKEAR